MMMALGVAVWHWFIVIDISEILCHCSLPSRASSSILMKHLTAKTVFIFY